MTAREARDVLTDDERKVKGRESRVNSRLSSGLAAEAGVASACVSLRLAHWVSSGAAAVQLDASSAPRPLLII